MKILLIDDVWLSSLGLKYLLEENSSKIFHVDILNNIDNLKCCLLHERYDLVLLDTNLKNITTKSSFEIGMLIRKIDPNVKVVFLTYYNRPIYEIIAKKIGANGYIEKNISISTFISTLNNIMRGNNHFNEVFTKKGKVEKIKKFDDVIQLLTPQEIKILELIRIGYEIKEISCDLKISPRTVSNHLNHIFKKLDVSNRNEAITKALELGYLETMKS